MPYQEDVRAHKGVARGGHGDVRLDVQAEALAGLAQGLAGVWSGWEDQAIHFENLSEGQGANMALPVFAIFLQKIYSDPQFGILEADEFERPAGFNVNLDCDQVRKNTRSRSVYGRERF
jgi:hypothetical protein